ncbi:MAG: hypothetical protein JRH11_03040 [Deltaproteobacteria bacterium]|nr:hypothetical protein [Deltaproteobacteria bacterium]
MQTAIQPATQMHGDGTARPLAACLGLGAEDVRALVRFAERDARRGRVDEALEALRVAAILDPREVAVWTALARCHEAAGNASESASAKRVGQTLERYDAQTKQTTNIRRTGR